MHRKTLNCSLLVTAVAVLGITTAVHAQVTTVQEEQWLNSPAATSHIGNITGRAKVAGREENSGLGGYRRYCLVCHGAMGDGNGESAKWFDPPMFPKPRDFTLAVFECRSTPTGTLPTDEDLFDTIARGIDRSNMPPWNTFTKQERADLVAWIKHYSPRWQTEKPGTPIQIPAEPEVTPDRVKNGREVFARVQCWKCHGAEGKGNGPSASTLQDDLGRPILPYNFAEGGRFKCGSTDRDLYKIFMTGLDGTPMPSFADNIKPDEAWDLVFYLRSLQPHNAFNAKEKQIAKQLGLKPINPNATTP
jgi:mono/diheme cytochrome c family protein